MPNSASPRLDGAPSRAIGRRAAIGLAAVAAPRPARPQRADWPAGPVRFVGLFPPGGGTG